MANFFASEKGFPNSKISRSSNNGNVTKNTNLPALSQFDHDVTVSPLSKEIDSRLKVLNKILPHEEVVQLSQDIINRLNAACFDRIAETVRSNLAITNTFSGASIACSSASQRTNAHSRQLPNVVEGNKELATQMMFKAAKNIRSQSNLGIINEEPHPLELAINSSRGTSKRKGRPQITTTYSTVAPSSNGDDSMCFRKPVAAGQNRKQRSYKQKTNSSVIRNQLRKEELYEQADMSTAACDLTITKASLRNSAGSRKNTVSSSKPKNVSKKNETKRKMDESRAHNDDEIPKKDNSALMLRIQNRPKKTALSPFFNRFKRRCSAGKTTSTPFKL